MKSAKANRELALARLRVNWKHSARPYRSCARGAMCSPNKLAVKWEVVVRSRNPHSSPHALLEDVHLSVISRGRSPGVLIFEGGGWRAATGFVVFLEGMPFALSVNCSACFIPLLLRIPSGCAFLLQGRRDWESKHALIKKSRRLWGETAL